MISLIKGFIGGFSMQIVTALIGIILTMGVGGFWYFNDSQETIKILNKNISTLEANESTLKSSIVKQNASIQLLDQQRIIDQGTVILMADSYAENQEKVDILQKKLDRHDLKSLTIKKPGLIEKIINRASVKVFEDFEMIGDPKTYPPIGVEQLK